MKSLLILISIIALVFSTPVEETNDIKDYIEIVKCFLEQQPLIDEWSFDKTEEKIMEEYEKCIENAKKYIDFEY